MTDTKPKTDHAELRRVCLEGGRAFHRAADPQTVLGLLDEAEHEKANRAALERVIIDQQTKLDAALERVSELERNVQQWKGWHPCCFDDEVEHDPNVWTNRCKKCGEECES